MVLETSYFTIRSTKLSQVSYFVQETFFLFQIAGRTDVNAKYTREVQVDKHRAVQRRLCK